jgi:CBS domain-containing membrane protein
MQNDLKTPVTKEILVTEIMTTNVITLTLDETLSGARSKFENLHLRHFPVVDGNRLLGILSLTDILRLSFGKNFGSSQLEADEAVFEMLSIDQVMKHNPITVNSKNSIEEVAEILANEEFHALPVVDDGELIGIVTTTDVIRYLLDR